MATAKSGPGKKGRPSYSYKRATRKKEQKRNQQLFLGAGLAALLLLAGFQLQPKRKVVDASRMGMEQPPAQEMTRAPQPPPPSALPQQTPMNALPLSEISSSMVDRLEGGSIPTLVFSDGTKRQLSPSEVSQLPGNLRILLEYNRNESR